MKIKNKTIIRRLLTVAFGVIFIAACSAPPPPSDSPTAALNQFIEASKNKDAAAIKNLLSKSTLDSIEKAAAAQNTTVDKILSNEDGTPLKELPETRNEKIEGETASVEVKNKITGEFETIPFVKENGVWKIALDKFMREMLEKHKQSAPAPTISAGSETDQPVNNK